MEDYKEKYEQAVLRMNKWVEGSEIVDPKEVAEYIFPELKESKDEKIREVIINVFDISEPDETWGDTDITTKDIIAWLEKQSEQKPTDKVEPKFKVKKGEWYICTNTFVSKGKIIAIKGQIYQSKQEDNTITCEDNCLFIDRHDGKAADYFRPWNIQDAKDGDVLVTNNDGICIFDGTVEDGIYPFAYCGLTKYGFESYDRKLPFTHDNNVYPATKEQRDLLFSKMKEAGYEWDAEKNELKKVESKSAWSEEDENILDAIIKEIEANKAAGPEYDEKVYDMFLSWLKSLRPQSHWKPSDEQIKAIKWVMDGDNPENWSITLKNLYQDLKKLKG